MNGSFVPVTAALGALLTGVLAITVVVSVVLALGRAVVVVSLLVPLMRQRLVQWMVQQEGQIWTDTLALVDAEAEKYRQAHDKDVRCWTNGDGKGEPALAPRDAEHMKNFVPELHLQKQME